MMLVYTGAWNDVDSVMVAVRDMTVVVETFILISSPLTAAVVNRLTCCCIVYTTNHIYLSRWPLSLSLSVSSLPVTHSDRSVGRITFNKQ